MTSGERIVLPHGYLPQPEHVPGTLVKLGHPRGPYSYLYPKEVFAWQHAYLVEQGYSGYVSRLAVNKLHDMDKTRSELYHGRNYRLPIDDNKPYYGYTAYYAEVVAGQLPRAVAVSLEDVPLLEAHVSERTDIFKRDCHRAAAQLMIHLAAQHTPRVS